MVYGLPYKGSKNAIANKIVFSLPNAEVFIDAFGGGGAITQAACLSWKFDKVIYNELNPLTFQYFKRAMDGDIPDKKHFVSRAEFLEKKDYDPFVKYLWSFANNGRDYIYGKEIERTKREAFENANSNKVRLQHIEALQRLQRFRESILCNLEIKNGSYDELEVPDNSIVYCDIPYKGTNRYDFAFDHEKFYDWACSQKVPVFISEYEMPIDRFSVYMEFEKLCSMGRYYPIKTIEKIFVPTFQRGQVVFSPLANRGKDETFPDREKVGGDNGGFLQRQPV